jgi:hypothetical protein
LLFRLSALALSDSVGPDDEGVEAGAGVEIEEVEVVLAFVFR